MRKLPGSDKSLPNDDIYYYAPVFASAQALRVLVYSIDRLHCELCNDGVERLIIDATGTTISAGWDEPCLIPHSYPNAVPLDGFWAFDFCCIPPHSTVIQNSVTIKATLNWAGFKSVQANLQGIRVIAQSNSLSFSLPTMAQ